jgi:hypothetical protein
VSSTLALLVPPKSLIDWFPAGEHCEDAADGDFILVNHGTIEDKLVGAGQSLESKLQPSLEGFTWCRHVAYSRGGLVSEMGPRGYERRELTDYQAELYARVRFNVGIDAVARSNAFDQACTGVKYDWGIYASLIVDGLSWSDFRLAAGDRLMCSAHATLLSMGQGLFPDRAAEIVIPARFAMWCGAAHVE